MRDSRMRRSGPLPRILDLVPVSGFVILVSIGCCHAPDGRRFDELRPIRITRKFTEFPAGSVLWEQGKTIVLCTASISPEVPPWFSFEKRGGWITAEYVMLPAATPQHKSWPKIGHTDGRGTEIQRLIGRAIRAAVDLGKIGPHTIALDCQVLQADGGTRTAAISAAYVALADAIRSLPAEVPAPKVPPAGRAPRASIRRSTIPRALWSISSRR